VKQKKAIFSLIPLFLLFPESADASQKATEAAAWFVENVVRLGLGLLAAYVLWTGALLIRDLVRSIGKKTTPDEWPLWRKILTRLAVFFLLVLSGFRLQYFAEQPIHIPGHLLALGWFLAAYLLFAAASPFLKKKVPAWAPALLAADAAFFYGTFRMAEDFDYLPNFTFLAICAGFLHLGFIIRKEFLSFLGTRRAVAAISVFILVFFGRVVEHRSWAFVDDLDRPGRAQIISGTQGRATAVWADEDSGFVYYVLDEDRTKIHGINPDTGKRFVFRDRREAFNSLGAGYQGKGMLATSDNPRGRSGLLFILPQLDVQATFASREIQRNFRMGPPAFGAAITKSSFLATTFENGKSGLVVCRMPMDGSEPKSDMGRGCRKMELDSERPGMLLADPELGFAYVLEKPSLLDRRGALFQIATGTMAVRKPFRLNSMMTSQAISPDRKRLFLALGLDKVILYLLARPLSPTLQVAVHIHPTTLIADSEAKNLYIGSVFDGSVQIMRVKNGLITRPIFAGPGIRDLALDEERNRLFAATEVGVVQIDLSMIPMPTTAARIEPFIIK